MRRYRKRELLDNIKTLLRMNELIVRSVKKLSPNSDIFIQCQEIAISVGSYLEMCGDATKDTVQRLEECCESIYQLSLVVENQVECQKIAKDIKRNLQLVSEEIETNLPNDKARIVFFPYKASMWDSMESVWKEAALDKNCETFVVPIPYYERNSDGSVGKMFYEGADFPESVEIVNWEKFSLAESGIDVAYVHNPYDASNRATCVHPDYFVENLRNYANKIVYIPYFATMNYVEEHLCTVPGVLFSDAIVVQTEKIKETYVKTMYRLERENQVETNVFSNRNRFYVFGNPKFDKVLELETEQYEIPKEWKKKIYREDGTKRKVVLFNSSVQELLSYGEVQINKIKQVISVFERRKDTILLWRPHPLNKSVIKSMLPNLLQKYRLIEEEFKKADTGIFDDSADMYKAIKISDAYYGTGGSLIPIYGLTGKPIMKQNINQSTEVVDDKKYEVTIADMHIDADKRVWFCPTKFNGLFCYDVVKEELKWKGKFPNEPFEMSYLYGQCIEYKNKLFFPPYAANELAIFDKTTEEFSKISINTYGIKGQKFYAITQYGGKMYGFGSMLPVIMVFDLETYTITYIETVHNELSKFFVNDTYPMINRDIVQVGNTCYLSSGRCNVLVELNLDDLSYKFYFVGNKDNYYVGMKKLGSKIYLLPRNAVNPIYWDCESEEVGEITYSEEMLQKENMFFNTCTYSEDLWLFPFWGDYIAKISKDEPWLAMIDSVEWRNESTHSGQKISWAYSANENVYFYSMIDKCFYVVNMENGSVSTHSFEMSEKDYKKASIMHKFHNRERCTKANSCIYRENETTTLEEYLNWIEIQENLKSDKQIQLFLSENAEGHSNCGKLCHERFNEI